MLQDEFKRLLGLFHDAAEGKNSNLDQIFREALVFFQHLKEQIAVGDAEDRKMVIQMMAELSKKMAEESKRIAQRTGMSEEQLMAFAENPTNFSKEQWASIQASKEQIAKAGKDLVQTVENTQKTGPSASEPKVKKPKKGGKSKWMRS